ncbi:MAG: hypothetical protein C4321_04245, partial [Chloroflexota bacterium]
MAANSGWVALSGVATQASGAVNFSGSFPGLSLQLGPTSLRAIGDSLDLQASIVNGLSSDRAIQFLLRLPVSPTGLKWCPDLRQSESISGAKQYGFFITQNPLEAANAPARN